MSQEENEGWRNDPNDDARRASKYLYNYYT